MSPSVDVSVSTAAEVVPAALREQILALDADARAADGAGGLDDQVRLDLGVAAVAVRHLFARRTGSETVLGYAHADLRAPDAVSAHLLVAPAERRRGVGAALLAGLTDAAAALPLRVWAHGNIGAARAFAKAHSFEPARELRKMRRPLGDDIATPTYDPQTVVRAFVPGRDEAGWVAVNAAAFSNHPEQGRLTVDDLRQRMEQPWFDAAGFFLAERGGELIGYHWTKVHQSGGASDAPIGEVYVLGVHPGSQGLGLGKALTLTGLRHLRDDGLDEVMLYVDGDNAPAVAVYERLGFTTDTVDVMYARSAT